MLFQKFKTLRSKLCNQTSKISIISFSGFSCYLIALAVLCHFFLLLYSTMKAINQYSPGFEYCFVFYLHKNIIERLQYLVIFSLKYLKKQCCTCFVKSKQHLGALKAQKNYWVLKEEMTFNFISPIEKMRKLHLVKILCP